MVEDVGYAIIGGGAAAAAAAEGIRSKDRDRSLALFAAEWAPPYQRPPLSKDFLQGRVPIESALMQSPQWYLENDIDIYVGMTVTAIDPARHTLHVGDRVLRFEKLLLATGAAPRTLNVPGADLEGIYTLRTFQDAQRLRAVRASARRVVVIGTGFIGMEVAASLRSGGADVVVTSNDQAIWAMFGSIVSGHVARLFDRHGVEVVLDNQILAFEGDTRVRSVATSRGRLDCDAVVVGVGVQPNDELARSAGLQVDNGIVVDDRLRCSAIDVYAAGDVARFPSPSGVLERVEHFDHAVSSGGLAGRNMAGADERYQYVPFFWSDVFELGFEFVGAVGPDSRIVMGELDSGSFITEYSRDGRLVGSLLAGRSPDESTAYRERLAVVAK